MYSSPAEITDERLECYLFGDAEEVISAYGASAQTLRHLADGIRELIRTTAEAVAVLEHEGWKASACGNAIYLSHPDIRFGE